ncbi:DUF2218 domain-containing protein [Advenella kashmirensis]|uniref:DUF2218 domain-containing protein n=1 Tax=Advenella kashmirensis TaxID=310575 RepID=UPI001EE644E1|nr:DUF2218 domain-containing protein [Advenella kashmirensis]
MMTAFQTSTIVQLDNAENVLGQILAHLHEHDLFAVRRDNSWQVDYADAKISFTAQADGLHAQVAAPSESSLYEGRMMVFHHIQEFGNCPPQAIQWQGDNVKLERPPAFRLITVQAVSEIGPHMRACDSALTIWFVTTVRIIFIASSFFRNPVCSIQNGPL